MPKRDINNALRDAASNGKLTEVKALLAKGADVNVGDGVRVKR